MDRAGQHQLEAYSRMQNKHCSIDMKPNTVTSLGEMWDVFDTTKVASNSVRLMVKLRL